MQFSLAGSHFVVLFSAVGEYIVPEYMFEKRASVKKGWAVLGVLRSGITK